MAEPEEIVADITDLGDPLTIRVDLNDGTTYTWDPRSDLGTVGVRRTILEAPNVDGGTVAARSRPLTSAVFVVNIAPQASLEALVAAYQDLKEALETPCSLTFAPAGWDPEDPFFIDLDSYDSFPNLISGQLPWTPGCEEQWFADTLIVPVLRHPRSYGAGTFL